MQDMAYALKFIASALVVVQLTFTGTLAQPKLPSAFSAQVTTYMDGYQSSGEVFVDYGSGQALFVTNLGLLSGAAGRAYTYITDSGYLTYRYLDAFDYCTDTDPATYYSFPQLNMLENGTYLRSHTFMMKQVDVYQYDVMDEYNYYDYSLQIAFLTYDYATPVYMIVSEITMVIDSYSNIPPSYSMFDLPEQCSYFAKNKKGKKNHGKAKMKSPFSRHNTAFMKKF